MADVKQCDRCGKVYGRSETGDFLGHEVVSMFLKYSETRGKGANYDLCPDCISELDEWFREPIEAVDKKIQVNVFLTDEEIEEMDERLGLTGVTSIDIYRRDYGCNPTDEFDDVLNWLFKIRR